MRPAPFLRLMRSLGWSVRRIGCSLKRTRPGLILYVAWLGKLHDFDPAQRVVMCFAQDFLKWASDPSMPRWGELFRGRNTVREVEDFFSRHTEDE
jgi:hypothetical protein